MFFYIPTFKQNIFSVEVVAENGGFISFVRNCSKLLYLDGKIFYIMQNRSLYYYIYEGNSINKENFA